MTTENNQPNPDPKPGEQVEPKPGEKPNEQVTPPGELPSLGDGVVAPKPEETPAAKFEKTGEARMDVALEFFGKAGLKPGDPEIEAAKNGDFSLLKAKLAAANKPGWAEHVALAEGSFNDSKAAETKKVGEVTAAVHGVFGGEAGWKEVQAWAKQNADPEEADQINAMFKAGPLSAKAAAQYLKGQYEAAGQKVSTPGKPALDPNRGGGNGGDGVKALSPREFSHAVQELTRTHGSRAVDNNIPEYKALVARRKAWRA